MHQKPNNSQSPTYPRSFKCDSRQTIQTLSDHPNRVVPPSGCFPGNMQEVAHTSDGSFCYKVQQQSLKICLTSPGPTGRIIISYWPYWENFFYLFYVAFFIMFNTMGYLFHVWGWCWCWTFLFLAISICTELLCFGRRFLIEYSLIIVFGRFGWP